MEGGREKKEEMGFSSARLLPSKIKRGKRDECATMGNEEVRNKNRTQARGIL